MDLTQKTLKIEKKLKKINKILIKQLKIINKLEKKGLCVTNLILKE